MEDSKRSTGRTTRLVIRAIGNLLSPNVEKKNTTFVTHNHGCAIDARHMATRVLDSLGLNYISTPNMNSIYFHETGNVLFFVGQEETHRTNPKFQNRLLDL